MTGTKILIVDDDQESRDLLREVLDANGYQATAVPDGSAARKELRRETGYRIVIADLRMPGESGLDLLRDLRVQDLPYSVVLMSSFIGQAQRRLATELSVDALLEKPFRLSELLQAVAELSGKSSIEVSGKEEPKARTKINYEGRDERCRQSGENHHTRTAP